MMEVPGLTKSLIAHLRGKIIRGELAPGERINEAQLAYDLGISRSPLREALRVLEKEHLITSIPRKGSIVTNVSIEDLEELYVMRDMIECYALDIFERKKVTELPHVTAAIANPRTLVVPTESEPAETKIAYIEAMAEFHLKFVESSGNRRLFEFYQMIHSDINRYVFLNAFLQGAMEHRVQEHHMILKLIKKGQYGKAEQLIRSHIKSSFADLKERMKKQDRSALFKYSITPPAKPVRNLQTGEKGRVWNDRSRGG